jgi:hypothetical protein
MKTEVADSSSCSVIPAGGVVEPGRGHRAILDAAPCRRAGPGPTASPGSFLRREEASDSAWDG